MRKMNIMAKYIFKPTRNSCAHSGQKVAEIMHKYPKQEFKNQKQMTIILYKNSDFTTVLQN